MQLYTRRRRSGFRLPVSAAFLDFYTSSLFCKSEKMDSISRIQLFVKLNMRDRLLFIAAASVLALLQLGLTALSAIIKIFCDTFSQLEELAESMVIDSVTAAWQIIKSRGDS